jgi:hypothetical protein
VNLTVAQLKVRAAELGIELPAKAKKAEIAALIDAAVEPLTVAGALERDLERFGPDLARSTLAASALALARELDDPDNSATSKSMCARALNDTLDRLVELAPDEDEKDALDDLAARRAARRSAA